ncbi:hypothetical protein HCN44_010026 [Aphidius gifuensis]|uniref:Uncharacterized protein n=1 Tax=Aphidius gifuensis TaxID=684658 RepID=A0A834Y5X1_APHGI|nr:hypothetical protein HCN44_010026 [Aphidius gifuensis]
MPKINKSLDEDRAYKKDWEKNNAFKGWLTKCPEKHQSLLNSGKDQAFCQWCKISLRCHVNTLKRHSESKGVSSGCNETKMIDIQLTMYAAIHGTMSSLDHLGETLKECGKGNSSGELINQQDNDQLLRTFELFDKLTCDADGLSNENGLDDDINYECE